MLRCWNNRTNLIYALHLMSILQHNFENNVKSMSVIGKVIGIAQKNNPQVYWHNSIISMVGTSPDQSNLHTYIQLASQLYKVQLHNLQLLCYKLRRFLFLAIYCILIMFICSLCLVVIVQLASVCLVVIVQWCLFSCHCIVFVYLSLYCVLCDNIVQAVQPFVLPFFEN